MLTVDSCLCFKLETGGLILGWLSLIGNILGFISCIVILILLCIFDCSDFAKLGENWTSDDLDLCKTLYGVVIGLLVLFIALSIGCAYIGWLCIKGTKSRNHARVKPLMILMGIATVLSLLQVLSFNIHVIVNGLVNGAVQGYCFIVLYSLYTMFKQEFESGGIKHQLYQAGKV